MNREKKKKTTKRDMKMINEIVTKQIVTKTCMRLSNIWMSIELSKLHIYFFYPQELSEVEEMKMKKEQKKLRKKDGQSEKGRRGGERGTRR